MVGIRIGIKIITLASAATIFLSVPAGAAEICKAKVLANVRAVQSPASVMLPGQYLESVTQFWRDKRTGRTTLCSKGGYCWPTHVTTGRGRVEALKLVNCRIGAKASEDGDEILYSVELDRMRNSEASVRYSDVSNQLTSLGLGIAPADNVAMFYTKRPASRCGILARKALEGSPIALKALQADPAYCRWWK